MPTYSITELDDVPITDDLGPGQPLKDTLSNFSPDWASNQEYWFPNNIGQSFQGHWMRLNIYAPNTGQATPVFDANQAATNIINAFTSNGGSGVNTSLVNQLSDVLKAVYNATNISNRQGLSRTAKLQGSVILAMPQSNLVFRSDNKYDDISITALQYGLAASVASGLGSLLGLGKGVNTFGVFNSVGKLATQATALTGYPLNPQLEILFTGRGQRQFQFEILMTPTNKDETDSIDNIIKLLRSTSSPQRGSSLGSLLMTPPSTYNIEFFKDGQPNTYIPKIKQCALQAIEVDYSPSGVYSTFSTGHPVQTRLSLVFREIEVLFQDDIQNGY